MATKQVTLNATLPTTITFLPTESGFFGYSRNGTSTYEYYCADGFTYATSSDLAGCCSSGDSRCTLVRCAARYDSYIPCPSQQNCNSAYIYDQSPLPREPADPLMSYECDSQYAQVGTYFRTIVDISTIISLTTSLSTADIIPPKASASIGRNIDELGGASSKAWIAGAVMGSIAAFAILIGAICFMLLRLKIPTRRSGRNSAYVPIPSSSQKGHTTSSQAESPLISRDAK